MAKAQTSQANQKAVFTEGSILRHVSMMASTGAIGLVAIFLVDVINVFYVSLLGQQQLLSLIHI